jgi:hypothetical protein
MNDLESEALSGGFGPHPARRQDLTQRVAAVERHDPVAHVVGGGVERDCQAHLRIALTQLHDPVGNPDRRDRDPSRADVESLRVHEHIQGCRQAVPVQQRLPHPHEDDVRPVTGRTAAGQKLTGLIDDLAGAQVASPAEHAGGAERAGERAPGLARQAQRVAGGGRDQDRLHRFAIDQPPQELCRPVPRDARFLERYRGKAEGSLQPLAQGA